MATELTLYQVLGVNVSSDAEELSRARKGLARILHPDRPGGDAQKMAEVNAAHATLSDPPAARRYAAELRSRLPFLCTRCQGLGYSVRMRGFNKKTVSICTSCDGAGRLP